MAFNYLWEQVNKPTNVTEMKSLLSLHMKNALKVSEELLLMSMEHRCPVCTVAQSGNFVPHPEPKSGLQFGQINNSNKLPFLLHFVDKASDVWAKWTRRQRVISQVLKLKKD